MTTQHPTAPYRRSHEASADTTGYAAALAEAPTPVAPLRPEPGRSPTASVHGVDPSWAPPRWPTTQDPSASPLEHMVAVTTEPEHALRSLHGRDDTAPDDFTLLPPSQTRGTAYPTFEPTGNYPAIEAEVLAVSNPAPALPGDSPATSPYQANQRCEPTPSRRIERPPEVPETRPTTLVFRQVAGLTAGSALPLTDPPYAFSDGGGDTGFTVDLDNNGNVIVAPGSAPAKVDGFDLDRPVILGAGVLDVGNAQFSIHSPTDSSSHGSQLAYQDDGATGIIGSPTPRTLIEVPTALQPSAPKGKGHNFWRRLGRSSDIDPRERQEAVDQLLGHIHMARSSAIWRQRQIHGGVAGHGLGEHQAGSPQPRRSRSDAYFGTVGVLWADRPWSVEFEAADLQAEETAHIQALLSLPSVPVAADLTIGPVGIVGPREAALACARHVVMSLAATSTAELALHLCAGTEQEQRWEWATPLFRRGSVDTISTFPVLVVDGGNTDYVAGLTNEDLVTHQAGLVAVADTIQQLPPFPQTVLQLSEDGIAVLTERSGPSVHGTPVGLSEATAVSFVREAFGRPNPAPPAAHVIRGLTITAT